MPKFQLSEFGEAQQELIFEPSNGDLRLQNACTLQRYENGCWQYVGDIPKLFDDVIKLQTENAVLISHMHDQEAKERAQLIGDELEDKFDDLAKAGKHLRQLERMLLEARKSYETMTGDCKEKLKTFDTLNTPYPE